MKCKLRSPGNAWDENDDAKDDRQRQEENDRNQLVNKGIKKSEEQYNSNLYFTHDKKKERFNSRDYCFDSYSRALTL